MLDFRREFVVGSRRIVELGNVPVSLPGHAGRVEPEECPVPACERRQTAYPARRYPKTQLVGSPDKSNAPVHAGLAANIRRQMQVAAQSGSNGFLPARSRARNNFAGARRRWRTRTCPIARRHTNPELISVNDDLGIRRRLEGVAETEQPCRKSVVADFAVETTHRAVFVAHRLAAAGDIDDAEADARDLTESAKVRHRPAKRLEGHVRERSRIPGSSSPSSEHSADATHQCLPACS